MYIIITKVYSPSTLTLMLVSTVPEGLDKTSLYCPVSPRTLLGIDRVASSLFVYQIQNVFLFTVIFYNCL